MSDGKLYTGESVARDLIGLGQTYVQHYLVARDKGPKSKFMYAIHMVDKPSPGSTDRTLMETWQKKPQECIKVIRNMINYLNLPDKWGFCPRNEEE
jgi:hypothetical protein